MNLSTGDTSLHSRVVACDVGETVARFSALLYKLPHATAHSLPPPLSSRSFLNASSMENNAMNSTETIPAFKRKLEIITRRSSTSKRRQIEIEIEEEEEVHDEKLEESISSSSSTSCDSCDEEEEEEEKEEVEKKIVALQRMVPGGEMLGVDKLFEETAGYILALQSQIKALRVLATFIQDFDKENRKFGG